MTGSGIQRSESFDLLRMDRQVQRRVAGRRAAKAAAMLGIAAVGSRRGGFLGWAAAALGVAALVREIWTWLEDRPEWRKQSPISLRRMLRGDRVDVSSVLSFPASDAPSPHDLH